ncbi:hypothetical protein ANCDUO_06916 [Ancylostoma duodenale]|uniref:Uncharacterized protein n=1 Tax=Ancylostoma duodenale TaxID=51022 RepID=A0A0C2D0E2_9BILA|nr:hypothetical protein ANCDUO_06916 [Ancylostoma duodenale]
MVFRLCLKCLKPEDCRIKRVGSGRDHASCCVIQNVHKPPPNARGPDTDHERRQLQARATAANPMPRNASALVKSDAAENTTIVVCANTSAHFYLRSMSDRSVTSPDLREAMDELDNVCLNAADQQTVLLQRILSQLATMSSKMTTMNFRLERLEHDNRALTGNTNLLVERSAPKSNCVFCSIEDNRDNHFSGRCSRYFDPVTRTAQAMVLGLCLESA